MPDIVVGALLGIGGVIVGAIIGSISSYVIARLQINARREELNQQLRHQEQEIQRDRLIGVRKDLLLDLRNIISEWVECSRQQVNMIIRVEKVIEKYDETSPERKAEIREFYEVSERMTQLSSRFGILRGQVSDSSLDNLIEVVRQTQYEVDIQRMPLIRFFNDPSRADTNTLKSALKKDESLLKEIRTQLLQVNKRIEELLSGEPSS